MPNHTYIIATPWGDIAEADTLAGAMLARDTMAAEHQPEFPPNIKGISITKRTRKDDDD